MKPPAPPLVEVPIFAPSPAHEQLAFAIWRFDVWMKGYGSYEAIHRAIRRGLLTPGKEYPKRENLMIRRSRNDQAEAE